MNSTRRLHLLVLALLTLQVLLSADQQPLVWGAALLVLLAGLKLRESRSGADLQRVALTEWVALGLLAVLQPALAPSLLQGVCAVLVLAAVLAQEGSSQGALGPTLRRSLQLCLAAVPLLVLLFLLLPRLGPLWSLGGAAVGRTGISGILDPGAISRLVEDSSPALRISWLQGAAPAPAQRYWRVLVLDRFDGRRWSRASLPLARGRQAADAVAPAPAAQQLWMAEPSPLPLLPWGGDGVPSEPSLRVSSDGLLVSPAAAGRRRLYGINMSVGDVPWRAVPPQPGDLDLPAGSNPRLEAIAAGWRQRPAAERVQAAQALMLGQGLRYTREPPPLPQQAPLDALLFDTRAGFCEHFASAFTALMRAAAVPARVVVGYQGGEWVAETGWGAGYLEVRQSDAHAWSEIWLPGEGWRRVDPTAWVAPERILEGPASGWRRRISWWRHLERSWTRLDLAWNRWVLRFDSRSQSSLLGRWQRWQGLLLLTGLAATLGPLVWWLQRPNAAPRERERQRLERLLAGLCRHGLEPLAGEDLHCFCRRAGEAQPELAAALHQLANAYNALRFAPEGRGQEAAQTWAEARRELAQALRRQRPRPVERAH